LSIILINTAIWRIRDLCTFFTFAHLSEVEFSVMNARHDLEEDTPLSDGECEGSE
jgi:hypothetical protein